MHRRRRPWCFGTMVLILLVDGCGARTDLGQVEDAGILRSKIPADTGLRLESEHPKTRKRQPTPLPAEPPRVAQVSPLSSTQEWGQLSVRLLYDGVPPVREPLKITSDIDFCGKQEVLEEDLIVDRQSHGLANVVVWLHLGRDDPLPEIHSSYMATAGAEVNVDAKGCRFEPHISLLRTTQTLVLRNRNPIGDSAKIDLFANPGINITIPVGGEMRYQIQRAERLPVRVSCSIHSWESAWLLVKEHRNREHLETW